MRILLDTHAFLWWLEGNPKMPARAQRVVRDEANEILVSAATAWEICTKHRIGKLPDAAIVAEDVAGWIASQGFEQLSISVAHAQRAGLLPGPHRDPFDRVLAASARRRRSDRQQRYGLRRLRRSAPMVSGGCSNEPCRSREKRMRAAGAAVATRPGRH